MTQGPWLPLLVRQSPPGDPLGWDEMLVGHDFGLLAPEEIQAWVRARHEPGAACQALLGLEDEALAGFEKALWDAITEVTGKTPRPGGQRWAKAQDRWRVALLKDAVDSPVSAEALAVLVEAIYEAVGCPEDMVGLWRMACAHTPVRPIADHGKIQAFIQRYDTQGSCVV